MGANLKIVKLNPFKQTVDARQVYREARAASLIETVVLGYDVKGKLRIFASSPLSGERFNMICDQAKYANLNHFKGSM